MITRRDTRDYQGAADGISTNPIEIPAGLKDGGLTPAHDTAASAGTPEQTDALAGESLAASGVLL